MKCFDVCKLGSVLTCSDWSSTGGRPLLDRLIISRTCSTAKAMVTQGVPKTPQAGRVTSSCSSWCFVFWTGRVVSGAVAPPAAPLRTSCIVAMGTGLDGTGMFSARIFSSGDTKGWGSGCAHTVAGHRRWRTCFVGAQTLDEAKRQQDDQRRHADATEGHRGTCKQEVLLLSIVIWVLYKYIYEFHVLFDYNKL